MSPSSSSSSFAVGAYDVMIVIIGFAFSVIVNILLLVGLTSIMYWSHLFCMINATPANYLPFCSWFSGSPPKNHVCLLLVSFVCCLTCVSCIASMSTLLHVIQSLIVSLLPAVFGQGGQGAHWAGHCTALHCTLGGPLHCTALHTGRSLY